MKISGHIVQDYGIVPGTMTFGTMIETIDHSAAAPDRIIIPGFIDTHVHGGGGADTMDGPGAIATMARFHLSHGTTTLLPTTITRPWSDVVEILRVIAQLCATGIPNGPSLHGAHLEGPFISPHRLGAQPAFAIEPTPEKVSEALETGAVRVVTLAPELTHAPDALQRFARAGVRVSFGHTTGSFEQTRDAICAVCAAGGTAGATHLFNAMGGLEGRKPGPAGAFLCSDAAFAELILDNHHVHPASFRLAHALMGSRLLLVTDSMRGAGMAEGESDLGGQKVMIKDGRATLPDGTLAGSVLTLDTAFRNSVAAGKSLSESCRLTSGNAARYLGLADRGALHPGLRADFVVMDQSLAVQEVWVGGSRVV